MGSVQLCLAAEPFSSAILVLVTHLRELRFDRVSPKSSYKKRRLNQDGTFLGFFS